MPRQKIVIIGAGIGGLAAAALLAKAGHRVEVYEKNTRPGGRADLLVKDRFRFDMGPSWYLMPDVFEHFYNLMDTKTEAQLDLIKLSPAYKVFFESKPALIITGDPATDSATFDAIEQNAGNALMRYTADAERTYRLALRHFLYTNFTSLKPFFQQEVLRHGLTMLHRAITPLDRYVSRFVNDQRLKQILEYPMVFLGTSPFEAPALYSLMSAMDFREGVFYPKGGLVTIIKSLVEIGTDVGVTYRYDQPVASIVTSHGKTTGITLADGSFVTADVVISNADLHFTETQLLQPTDQTYPSTYWAKQTSSPSALLLYLGVRGALPELEHHNLLFVDDWRQNFDAIYKNSTFPDPASIYICKPSASDDSVAPKGHENVFMLVPLPPNTLPTPDQQTELIEQYLQQIETTTGIGDLRQRIVSQTVFGPDDFLTKFHSHNASALGPSHTLRQSAFFRARNVSKKVSNLYYVGGSTVPGIGLPMCLISAELVYKRVIGDTSAGPVATVKRIV